MSLFSRPAPPASPAVHVTAEARPSSVEHAYQRPLLRTGMYAWAVVGIAGAAIVAGAVLAKLSLVVVPLVLALFPAAVLAPLVGWLTRRRVPPALAALLVLVGSLGLVGGIVALISPAVAAEADNFREAIGSGIDTLDRFLARGPFGLDPIRLDELVDRAGSFLSEGGGGLTSGLVGALVAVTQGLAGFLFGLVALFLYLKDGPRIAAWLRNLFPEHLRDDASQVGVRSWQTVGAYVRGQVLVALVDAVLIGLGLLVIGVPLVLPLSVIIFFGGLFPIVGAFASGGLAVLVALATLGLPQALLVLAVIVAVQQLEGNLLSPIVLGRATQLHPLATLTALTAGAILLGILGAFLAVPIAASVTRAAQHLRLRHQQMTVDPVSRTPSSPAVPGEA